VLEITTVAQALTQAQAMGIDRLDAQLMLCHLLHQTRTWLLVHDDAPIAPATASQLHQWFARRANTEPLAYLLGEKEFYGLTFKVTPAVLVPRPDTEVLVDWALSLLPTLAQPAQVVDLGTGSGAIALAVKHRYPHAQVSATDLSEAALEVARENAARHRLNIHFTQGPWWQAVPSKRFHLALSNPPYIAGLDHHLDQLTHEPRMALTPEGDGLQALRDIIQGAVAHLHPGGWLVLEHGYDQAQNVAQLLHAAGFSAVSTRSDLGGNPRCTAGRCNTTNN
jgi:release factor glutamine methyltransferase